MPKYLEAEKASQNLSELLLSHIASINSLRVESPIKCESSAWRTCGAGGPPARAASSGARFGALGAERAKAVVDSGAALPLLFARHELGYVYASDEMAQDPNYRAARGAAGGRRGELIVCAT